MGEFVISLDCGKHSVKAIGRNTIGTGENVKKVKFRTKLYNLKNGYVELEGNSYKVQFNGQTYIIGDQGEEDIETYSTNKTTVLHQVCSYTAIAQFLKPNTKDNKINIVLACPVSILKNAAAKEEYKNFIKGNGPIKIKINDAKYEFEITNVTIKAEGSGLLYLQKDLFINNKVALIDFGGLNMSFALYVNGTCKPNDRFAAEHGTIKLTNYIAEDLTNYFSGKKIITTEQAEEALEDGHINANGTIDKGSIEVIENSKKRFFNEAIKLIERQNYSLGTIKTLAFVGGTTKKLENVIRNTFTHSNINNEWTTAEGLFRVACAKYIKE